MKKEVKVTVFKNNSCKEDLCGTSQKVLDWWNAKFSLIPEEYKNTAQVECEIHQDYDYSMFQIEIYYYRIETDEEYNNRINQEIVMNQAIRDKELEVYRKLKDKYGDIGE